MIRLNSKQLYYYRNALNKIHCGNLQLFENGIFEYTRLSEMDKNKVVNFLRSQSFIKQYHVSDSRYDFGDLSFNMGRPIPKKFYTVRGVLNEPLKENIEIHDKLNPKIWNRKNELLPKVKDKIEEIVDKFSSVLQEDGVELKIKDIYLLGSNANYNYTTDSDLDVHIMADESFDCSEKHLQTIYYVYKKLFNETYDITINGVEVEIYVENADKSTNVATGVYSLNKGWIKKPAKIEIPKLNEAELSKIVSEWEKKYLMIMKNPSIKKIDKYLDDIYVFRQDGLSKEGEFSINNQGFKEIRKLGYLDDLKEQKLKLESEELSLKD